MTKLFLTAALALAIAAPAAAEPVVVINDGSIVTRFDVCPTGWKVRGNGECFIPSLKPIRPEADEDDEQAFLDWIDGVVDEATGRSANAKVRRDKR